MFLFSSKSLAATLLVAAPLVVGCAVSTGAPGSDSSSASPSTDSAPVHFSKGGTVLIGVETPVALRTYPKALCGVSTVGDDGPVEQGTVPADDDGDVHVTVEAQDDKPFSLELACVKSDRVGDDHVDKVTYSFDFQGVQRATKLNAGE